ncbi:MAG: hypothetical protein HY716_05620 [Planctomycetes bacterium]|nr:hypothetical protein [Planctomycetota bacterium]
MTRVPFLALMLWPVQDGLRDSVLQDVREYTSLRAPEERRLALFDRLAEYGPLAIGYLHQFADKTPHPEIRRRYRYLNHEIKRKLLEMEDDRPAVETLTRLRSDLVEFDVDGVAPEELLIELRKKRAHENFMVDPAEQELLGKQRLSGASDKLNLADALDRVLGPAGLDFHVRGKLVIIARRDRLWMRAATFTVPPLSDGQRRDLEEAFRELDSERPEERAAAERRILAVGLAATPRLESALRTASGDARERLRRLALQIRAPLNRDPLHVPGSARSQKLEGDDRDLLGRACTNEISVSFRAEPLASVAAKVAEISEIPIGVDPDLPEAIRGRPLTFAVHRVAVLDLLEALAQPLGADVVVRQGTLRIAAER